MYKKEIAKKIQEFMYASDLPLEKFASGTSLISPTYLKSILASAYSDNSKLSPYSIIAGDFDGLSKLNNRYGFKEANRCICECLNIITKELPKDAIISRYAGDEFLFILPSVANSKTANLYMQKINKTISNQSSDIHDLSISLATADSSKGSSLIDMYDIADKKIFNKKAKHDKDGSTLSLHDSLETFFSSMRFSNDYKISEENVKGIIREAWQISLSLIQKYHSTGILDTTPKMQETKPISLETHYSQDDAIAINDALLQSKSKINDQLLDLISEEALNFLAKNLVFNNASNAFSKEYFMRFLQSNLPEQNYNLSLFSLSGLKLSNLLNGHVQTDGLLYDLYSKLSSPLESLTTFNETPFTANLQDSFKIDLRGGDLLFITPQSNALPVHEMLKSANDPSSILKYVAYSSKNSISAKEISDFIQIAKERSDSLKDVFKEKILHSHSLNMILSSCLSEDVKNYCINNPDYINYEKLEDFLYEEAHAVYDVASHFSHEDFKAMHNFVDKGKKEIETSIGL